MAEAEWKQLFQEPPKVTAESQQIKEKMATALTFARICFRYGANGMTKVLDSSVVEWERIALPVSKILQKERNQVEILAKDAEIQAAIDYILENGWFNTCEDLAMVAKYELTSVQKMALTQIILKTNSNEFKSPPNISVEKTEAGVAPAQTGIDETAILEHFYVL
ncbi:uncharacterized protein LOC135943691 [Cloeon dipterum]|uniref:uncharacterized protein LOC135943691 n=1 Tax=Cloeon dipterum TaxID=197152 RepID=UPI0032208CEC